MNRGILYGILVVLIWSWVTIFVTLLSDDFDVTTQNFYRYSAGSLFILSMALVFKRREFLQARSKLPRLLLLGFVVFIFQEIWVQSIYWTTPTTAVLLSKLDIVSIASLSALFFVDERRIVKNKFFLLGATLALLGVVGVVLGKGEGLDDQFNIGIGLLLLRSLIWGIYIVSVKALVKKEEPLVAAAWIYLFASIMLLPVAALWGDLSRVVEVPLTTNVMLFGSGALCVGLGNALNFTAIKHIGSTVSTTLLLVTPFTAGVLSYFFCDEELTALQIISGLVIIASCWLIVRKVVAREEEEEP